MLKGFHKILGFATDPPPPTVITPTVTGPTPLPTFNPASIEDFHLCSSKVLWRVRRTAGYNRGLGRILGLGMFPEGERPYEPSAKFLEGFLWGSISFHVGQLSKTTIGKITDIRELPPAPMSTGLVTLRLLTLDTSVVGPLALSLLRPGDEKKCPGRNEIGNVVNCSNSGMPRSLVTGTPLRLHTPNTHKVL